MNKKSIIPQMFSAGVQYGHNKRYWNPEIKHYIYQTKNKMNIFNLVKTEELFNTALDFISEVASNKGQILLIGTKLPARDLIKSYAESCKMPFVNIRWLGGTLTNYMSIRHSVKRLEKLEAIKEMGGFIGLPKKEIIEKVKTIEKLKRSVGGIATMRGMPSAVFIIDVKTEHNAVLEAKCLNIPVVAIVDSNSSLKNIDYPIPGNDDSMKAIDLYLGEVSKRIIDAQTDTAFAVRSESQADSI